MNATKITYWITTGIVSALMLYSAYAYFTNPGLAQAFVHLGFPDWFRVELGTAKFLGALALAIPIVPARVKEWAYVGFFINFFSAALAHIESGDPFTNIVSPVVLLVILVISYVTFHKKSVNISSRK